MTLAWGRAVPARWHESCVKNGAEETCLALRRLKEQRADAQGGSFLSLEVRMCQEQELCLLSEGEGGKSQIWKLGWNSGVQQAPWTRIWIQLWVFFTCSTSLLHPPSYGDHQWPSHRQPFATSLHSQPPEVFYQTPWRYLKGQLY